MKAEKILAIAKDYFNNVSDEQFKKDWKAIKDLNLGGIKADDIL